MCWTIDTGEKSYYFWWWSSCIKVYG